MLVIICISIPRSNCQTPLLLSKSLRVIEERQVKKHLIY